VRPDRALAGGACPEDTLAVARHHGMQRAAASAWQSSMIACGSACMLGPWAHCSEAHAVARVPSCPMRRAVHRQMRCREAACAHAAGSFAADARSCDARRSVVMVPDPQLDAAETRGADEVLASLEEFRPERWGLPPFPAAPAPA
jgi:hypothetical protein